MQKCCVRKSDIYVILFFNPHVINTFGDIIPSLFASPQIWITQQMCSKCGQLGFLRVTN